MVTRYSVYGHAIDTQLLFSGGGWVLFVSKPVLFVCLSVTSDSVRS